MDSFRLFEKTALLKRIEFAVAQGTPITLIVGAPISFDFESANGVPTVEQLVDHIRQAFADDPSALKLLADELASPKKNPYQVAFERAIAYRGLRFANDVVRRGVLKAYNGNNAYSLTDDVSLNQLQADIDNWYLPPAVEAIGKLLCAKPKSFGDRILTTNFDPLIEIAIRRAGGDCVSSFFHGDGNPSSIQSNGLNVIHCHGFWTGSDTLHTPSQLLQARPKLRAYLSQLIRDTVVVVVGCGGWDDVLMGALGKL